MNFDDARRRLTTDPGVTRDDVNEIKQHLAELFDVPPELLEPTAEEVELRRRHEQYRAELPDRAAKAAVEATRIGHAEGWLPDGWTVSYG